MSISVLFPPKTVLVLLLKQLGELNPETVTAEELVVILDQARESL